MFLKSGSHSIGRPFKTAGRAGWPYLELEVLDLRNSADIENCRFLLRELELDKDYRRTLDRGLFAGPWAKNLRRNVTERARYLGKSLGFCSMVESDIPWLIAEGSHLSMESPLASSHNLGFEMRTQAISAHPYLNNTAILRNSFRCFHRSDGMPPLTPQIIVS